MRHLTVVALLLGSAVSPAGATAGLLCRGEDDALTFGASAAFGRSVGGGLVNFAAALELRSATIPADLRVLVFDRGELSQIWFHHRDIKLELHHERPVDGPSGYVNLVVETIQDADDESLYYGRYELTVAYSETKAGADSTLLELRGDVACSVE